MTSALLPLDSQKHLHHGWKRYTDYRFAATVSRVPMLIQELPAALPVYPLAFVHCVTNGWQLAALTGLHDGENLFVDAAGKWLGNYIPSHFRAYPFSLHDVAAENGRQLVLCFDQASGLYREKPDQVGGEERFFDNHGAPRPLVQQLLTFLKACAANSLLTKCAVDALDVAGLLEPWELPLGSAAPVREPQQGLYRVCETKFNALNGQSLETLRNANALALAYAQIFSQPRLGVLHHLQARRTPQPPAQTQALLNELFGNDQDDLLSFI